MPKAYLARIAKTLISIGAVIALGLITAWQPGRAANDNNGAQDEKAMISTGLSVAESTGITLNMTGKDPDLVGLGSYIVNVTSDCNLCHSPVFVTTAFTEPTGNPYLRAPFFTGAKKIDPQYYLGGNQNFGPPAPGFANIISRNLTPDKTGMPEGHTLPDFIQIMRTGIDMDHMHPDCSATATVTTNCLPSPFNGDVLQVMPWPFFQNMTDRQLTAIYVYLSAIPCLEGGPGEPQNRCS